ncbi:MAG TPA: VOC family protein [Actinophytocola sp.]|jgi:hypothetical protein|uniref:VOC family protein n=1 Tax=Actinophytocola sp. TaxID=1872138 RepID=UPI002DFE31B9|nr:VOC family protein [Actinophytocola sp.]
MPAKFKDLVLDANDHHALADFWCAALGYRRKDELDPPEDGWVRPAEWPVPIADPTGEAPLIWVQPVPEPKTAKNRLHIDVFGSLDELLGLGATLVRKRDDEIEWDVLADPEGNEFCVFAPR